MNTLTPNCQVKIALLLQGNTVLIGARGQKRDRIFDKGNNRALNQEIGNNFEPPLADFFEGRSVSQPIRSVRS